MAQNRKAPAYQEYAADILSNREYRLMTLAERGLFITIRLECWQNNSLPADLNEMAKCLGFDTNEIEQCFTAKVKSFYEEKDGALRSVELDNYKQHLTEIRYKQSQGGKKGSRTTNTIFDSHPTISNNIILSENRQHNQSESEQANYSGNTASNNLSKMKVNRHVNPKPTNVSLVEFRSEEVV